MHGTKVKPGASGQGPSQPILALSCESLCCSSPSCSLGTILPYHSFTSLQGANVVSWELPDTPVSPPNSLLGRRAFFEDCWTASKIQLNDPARKAVFSPTFQARKLRLDEFSRPAANVLIICTFPRFSKQYILIMKNT